MIDIGLQVWVAGVNFVLCMALGYACACRLALMTSETTSLIFRAKYALLFVAASASGFGPIFTQWPTVTQCFFELAVLIHLGGGMRAWSEGIPHYARKKPKPKRRQEVHA